MKVIKVTKNQLDEIIGKAEGTIDWEVGPYEAAMEAGFHGFAGGLDHTVITDWSYTMIDRGVSGNRIRDNSTKFIVPVKDR